MKFGRREIGKVVRYLPDKKKTKIRLGLSSSCYCADRAQNLQGPAPDNVIMYSECSRFHPNRFAFGGFISEHHQNGPWSVSNIWL